MSFTVGNSNCVNGGAGDNGIDRENSNGTILTHMNVSENIAPEHQLDRGLVTEATPLDERVGLNMMGLVRGNQKMHRPIARGGYDDKRRQKAVEAARRALTKRRAGGDVSKKIGERKDQSDYAGLDSEKLQCHLCKVSKADGRSFVAHLRSIPHENMLKELEQSYQLKTNNMRQEARKAEFRRTHNLPYWRKNISLEFCFMCNLLVYGNVVDHCETDYHVQLKKFLRPSCETCSIQFRKPIDYDIHLLSADHMNKNADWSDESSKMKRPLIYMPIRKNSQELNDVRIPQKKILIDGDVDLQYKESVQVPVKVSESLPKYNGERPVGCNFIVKADCYECNLCEKHFETEKTAAIHTYSVTHYENFVKLVKEKSRASGNETEELDEQLAKEIKMEVEVEDQKLACDVVKVDMECNNFVKLERDGDGNHEVDTNILKNGRGDSIVSGSVAKYGNENGNEDGKQSSKHHQECAITDYDEPKIESNEILKERNLTKNELEVTEAKPFKDIQSDMAIGVIHYIDSAGICYKTNDSEDGAKEIVFEEVEYGQNDSKEKEEQNVDNQSDLNSFSGTIPSSSDSRDGIRHLRY